MLSESSWGTSRIPPGCFHNRLEMLLESHWNFSKISLGFLPESLWNASTESLWNVPRFPLGCFQNPSELLLESLRDTFKIPLKWYRILVGSFQNISGILSESFWDASRMPSRMRKPSASLKRSARHFRAEWAEHRTTLSRPIPSRLLGYVTNS